MTLLLAVVLVVGSVAVAVALLFILGIQPLKRGIDSLQTLSRGLQPATLAAASEGPRDRTEGIQRRDSRANILRTVSFQEFVAQVTSPEHQSNLPQAVWTNEAKRFFDVVAVGSQALESCTSLGIEFGEKGQSALKAGGQLMQHQDKALAVVVDSSGKIVEIGHVVGRSALQISLSVYTVAVTLAWTLVASDLKKTLAGVELKLDQLLDLHRTAEWAEFESAYEGIRFITDTANLEDRLAAFHAVTVAKTVRSRCRQRLANQADKLQSPSFFERLLPSEIWIAADIEEVQSQMKELAQIQLAVLVEAHASMLLVGSERQGNFVLLMQEEAALLREISGRYTQVWDKEKKRRDAQRPILITSIDAFAASLVLPAGGSSEVLVAKNAV